MKCINFESMQGHRQGRDEYMILIKVSTLGNSMVKVALGEFSRKKFLASLDFVTMTASFFLRQSIVKQIKLLKGEGY